MDKVINLFSIQLAVFLIFLGLLLFSILCFYLANEIQLQPENAYLKTILNSLGGAFLAIAVIDLFHEYFVAKQVRTQFQILDDFRLNGVERICTSEEIAEIGMEQLSNTKTFSGVGYGFNWLLSQDDSDPYKTHVNKNHDELIRILSIKSADIITILIPDPLSKQLIERYDHDEPESAKGLPSIAEAIKTFRKLQDTYQKLEVKVYSCYPMANVTIYDKYIFVSAVLYQQRAKDGFTMVYRKGTDGANIYENHFRMISQNRSKVLSMDYMNSLKEKYP